jgi:GAF domain-containing protein
MKEWAAAGVEGLVQDLERVREERRAVGDVLRAVTRGEGLQPVLDEIVAAALRLCDGEHAQLYLGERDVFHIASESGGQRAGFEYDREHPHLRDRKTVVGRVALSGEVAQIADVLADPDYDHGAQAIVGFRALLGVPIVLEGS